MPPILSPLNRAISAIGIALILTCPTLRAQSNYETPYQITTLAGASSMGNADGPPGEARFGYATGIAVDPAGNIYVADSRNATVRRIAPDGQVATLAGKFEIFQSVDGSLADARFNRPLNIARDSAGNLYISEFNAIRKITPAGQVSTFAGRPGSRGDTDGQGDAARFHDALNLAVGPDNTVYVADTFNNMIRRITPDGVVATLAGQRFPGETDGTGFAAQFFSPTGIAVTSAGTVYVSDAHTVRQITPAGVVTTLVRSLQTYRSIATDSGGNLYAMGFDGIDRIGPTGIVTPLLGLATMHENIDWPPPIPQALWPVSLATDTAGNLFFLDENAVRKLSLSGTVSTVAGLPEFRAKGNVDGIGTTARFGDKLTVATTRSGDLFVADTYNHTIRKVTPAGVVTTFAGDPGNAGSADGTGNTARFSLPEGIVADANDNLYVNDTGNHTVRKITPAGVVATLAGSAGVAGTADGTGSAARFTETHQLAISPGGILYTLDLSGLRRITPAGSVTTLPVSAGEPATIDRALAFTADGRLFVASQIDIQEISPTTGESIGLLAGANADAGRYPQVFGADGFRESAHFFHILGFIFDPAGNALVADTYNNTIRRVTPAGVTTTLAGLSGPFSVGFNHIDGIGRNARFKDPSSVALDGNGNLYVADIGTIRKGRLAGPPAIATQPTSATVQVGARVQFSVSATAVPDPTYQWYVDDAPFIGATASTLSFTNARASDAGDYTVVVTNALGSITSNKATLTVTAAPTPPPPVSSGGGGGGGGGAPSVWFLLALVSFATVRRLTTV